MKLKLNSVDYCPNELHAQLPIVIEVLRQIRGKDRPDYFLGRCCPAIEWIDGNDTRKITHVVICARYVGQTIERLANNLAVGIAYVTVESQITENFVDFSKVRYSAIGLVTDLENSN
ncbi:MAG: hypothetical protein R3C60_03265 [Parvularculaceae bacterium]